MGKTTAQARNPEAEEPAPAPLRPSKPFLVATAGLLLGWIGFLTWLAYYSG